MTITSKEADRLMDFASYIFLRNSNSWNADEATEFARTMFKEFAAIEGITEVDIATASNECDEQCFVEESDDLEIGFNPYMGEYDYDC